MEYVQKFLVTLLGVAAFLGSCALVIAGQKQIGLSGLGLMILGLAGMIVCLFLYNRTHR